jgi:hypothetical protein
LACGVATTDISARHQLVTEKLPNLPELNEFEGAMLKAWQPTTAAAAAATVEKDSFIFVLCVQELREEEKRRQIPKGPITVTRHMHAGC